MKPILGLISCLLFCVCACRTRPEIIPPFSPPLSQTPYMALPHPAALIFSHDTRTFVFTENGALIEAPSGKKLLDLNVAISQCRLISAQQFVVRSIKQYALIGVSAKEIAYRPLPLPPSAKLLGSTSRGFLIGQPESLTWIEATNLAEITLPVAMADFISLSETPDGSDYLVTQTDLYQKKKQQQSFSKTPLEQKITAPAAILGQYLMAMDTDHHLLKHRLLDGKLIWEKPLDHFLLHPVLQSQDLLLVCTRSAALLAMKENGSQSWYAALGGVPVTAPFTLTERIGVVVRSKDKLELQIYNRKGQLLERHPLVNAQNPPFLVTADSLFYSGTDALDHTDLYKATTLFQIDSSVMAQALVPKDQSLPIHITVTNLLKADHQLQILNAQKQIIWEARILPGSGTIPTMTPVQIGKYTLTINTTSQNHAPLFTRIPFTVYDKQVFIYNFVSQFLPLILAPLPAPSLPRLENEDNKQP